MSTLALVVDSGAVVQKALTYPDQARALVITDSTSYAAACEFLKGIKALRSEIADTFEPHIRRAHQAHKALVQEQKDAEAQLADAERIAKAALVLYDQAQARARQAEQERIQAELRKQEEERRLAEAVTLAEQGEAEAADAVLDAPIPVVPVAVAPTLPKVAGIAYRETWGAQVTDLLALVKFVAQHPQFLGLLQANTVALNAQARSLKAALALPGVEAVCTRDVAAGRR